MTHIDNVAHILENGITHKDSDNRNPNFITIGDLSLIGTRKSKQVRVDNGDFFAFDSPIITLGDFIPFYFGVRMPMLYVMQNGGNFVERATPAQNIVYLVCSVSKIAQSKEEYYFTDGHATDGLTSFYDKSFINNLPEIIHWDSVKAKYWGGDDNLNIKRKKQAEFLVSGDIPPKYLLKVGCYNESAQEKLINMGVEQSSIKVIPEAYY